MRQKALRLAPWFPSEGLAVKTPLSRGERPALQAWAQLTPALSPARSLCLSRAAEQPPAGHWLPITRACQCHLLTPPWSPHSPCAPLAHWIPHAQRGTHGLGPGQFSPAQPGLHQVTGPGCSHPFFLSPSPARSCWASLTPAPAEPPKLAVISQDAVHPSSH